MTFFERLRAQPRWRILTAAAVVLILVGGAIAATIAFAVPKPASEAVAPTASSSPTPTPTPTPTPEPVALPTADAAASFDGWSQDNEQDAASTFTAEAGDPADGAIALRLTSTNPAANTTRRALSQVVTVAPSTTYTFTASVQGSSSSKAKPAVAVIMGAEGQGRYDFDRATTSWSEQTWKYTTGAAETQMPVSLLAVGPVSGLSLDRLTMTAGGAGENLLANPSFESFSADNPRITNSSLMLTTGAEATLGISWRVAGASWTVVDETGASAATGTLDLQPGLAVVSLQDLDPGYYSIDIVNNDDGADHIQTSLAILDPLAKNAS
ncbi:MAG: hypothetical protein ABWX92_05385, partial [Mycetocola sp.]